MIFICRLASEETDTKANELSSEEQLQRIDIAMDAVKRLKLHFLKLESTTEAILEDGVSKSDDENPLKTLKRKRIDYIDLTVDDVEYSSVKRR